jgi:hypothetical protein
MVVRGRVRGVASALALVCSASVQAAAAQNVAAQAVPGSSSERSSSRQPRPSSIRMRRQRGPGVATSVVVERRRGDRVLSIGVSR